MTSAARHALRVTGAASAVAALAALGLPAVVVAAGLAVLLLVAVCWVLGSRERSDHLARIILGLRGDSRCLYSPASPEHDASPTPTEGAPHRQETKPTTGFPASS